MEQTSAIVGNFRVAIGGVVITFNIMDNPETIVADLRKANAICTDVLSHLNAPIDIGKEVPAPKKAKPAVTMIATGENTTQIDHVDEIKIDNTVKAHAAAVLPETAQPAPEVVATADVPPTVEAEPVYTLADMRKLLGEIIDLGHRPAAEQYVQHHCKTKRTSEIPQEQYPAIMKDLAALADGLRSKKINSYDDFAKAMGYELSSGED